MKSKDVCNQEGCDKPAAFLFTWPGENQKGICREHAAKLTDIANAIGLHVQLIEVESA